MSNSIRGFASLRVDDKNIIVLTDSYKGSPLIYYSPDMIIMPQRIFDKYSQDHFRIDFEKTKLILI